MMLLCRPVCLAATPIGPGLDHEIRANRMKSQKCEYIVGVGD